MAKIVVNKNFNDKYLKSAYQRLFQCDYDINTWYSWDKSYYSWDYGNHWGFKGINAYHKIGEVANGKWYGICRTIASTDNSIMSRNTAFNSTFPNQYFLANETTLKMLDSFNKKVKNGLDTFPKLTNIAKYVIDGYTPYENIGDWDLNMNLFMATLFNNDKVERDSAIDYLVYAGCITVEEADKIKPVFTVLTKNKLNDNTNLTSEDLFADYNDYQVESANGTLTIDYDIPMLLRESYNSVEDNSTSEQIYLLTIPYSDTKFKDGYKSDRVLVVENTVEHYSSKYPSTKYEFTTNGDYSDGYITIEMADSKYATPGEYFHKKNTDEVVPQISYVALSLGEVGTGADIEYDHVDKIEYIDSIKISIDLPKEYN